MNILNRKFTLMGAVFASLLTFTASANSLQPAVESSIANLVVSQGQQVITHLQTELAQSIQKEIESFSLEVVRVISGEEQVINVTKNEDININLNITTEE